MTKPTREEVADAITRIEYYRDAWVEDFNVLKQAYLAQEEELERKDKLIKMQDGFITDKSKIASERSTQISQLEVELDQLKAENQALKDDVARLKTPTIIGSYERETIVFDQDEEDTLP